MICKGRKTLLLLSYVRLTLAGGVLSVDATDKDNALISTIAVESVGAGSVAAPTTALLRIVSRLSGPIELEITPDDTALTIRGGDTTFSLSCMDAGDYDLLFTSAECAPGFSLTTEEVCGLLRRTRHCVSTEETRYHLNGVHFFVASGMLHSEATDGRRLARITIPAPAGAGILPAHGVIIPKKTVRVLFEMLQRGDEPVAFAFSADKLRGSFQRGHATLRAKMINGTFPDVDRVISKDNDKVATLDTKALAGLLHRVAAACSRNDVGVRLTLTTGKLVVSVDRMLWGSATGGMGAAYDGPRFEVGFNRRYLGDILRVSGEQIRVAFSDQASPVLFTDPADPSCVHVLMPMRVV